MDIRDGLIGSIGNTPLIKLQGLSAKTGCTILGKAEFLNPGGSVKDRAGRYIIEDAEKTGRLEPGGIIVEGTAGNTGIGLAGAMRLAEKLGPGKTIVTVLCDSGTRYASKLWNPAFLRQKNLPVPAWLERAPPRDITDVMI